MSNGKIETRTLSASLRAASDKFEITGIAAAYNTLSQNLGGFREQIAPGAFKRSLESGQDCKCLFNHNADAILGRRKSGTLTLQDSKEGLRFRCTLDRTSTLHSDVYASIKRGDISECSFAFQLNPDGDVWDEGTDENGQRFQRRTLKDISLFDVSAVTNPAYNQGTSVAARSVDYVVAKTGDVWTAEEIHPTARDLHAQLVDIDHRHKADLLAIEIGRS